MPSDRSALTAILDDLSASTIKLRAGEAFPTGETRSAHNVLDEDGRQWVVKWSAATSTAGSNLERLVAMVDKLRAGGYPAPAHLAIGTVDGFAYWVQERLPGEPIHSSPRSMPAEPQLALLARQLVELAARHEAQGDLVDPPWPQWLLRTLFEGGDGYCLHDTMRGARRTAEMLDDILAIAGMCRDAPVRRHDVMHFDFSYANALTDGFSVTGVIDWNVPFEGALQGDLAFDLATLLFYAYDRPLVKDELWRALLEWAHPQAAGLYLAHLTLRQVEWVERFYPGTYEHQRFVTIGSRVLEDVLRLLTD